ncbi:hypothetical protein BOTBODRAFT_182215 [Botryobasidium botryosum FD-172 SS1]|uniref:Uncharacterized protein n=1 Tax=Botryobasidium botryosum (strain FD-172 SS1) TaxID=930990 RepID=A0A067M1V5_BOTB1|nr:hypothetical protein BOTBODRAFT_182215 [Botryobasidium botryosum FD-172 SS1]
MHSASLLVRAALILLSNRPHAGDSLRVMDHWLVLAGVVLGNCASLSCAPHYSHDARDVMQWLGPLIKTIEWLASIIWEGPALEPHLWEEEQLRRRQELALLATSDAPPPQDIMFAWAVEQEEGLRQLDALHAEAAADVRTLSQGPPSSLEVDGTAPPRATPLPAPVLYPHSPLVSPPLSLRFRFSPPPPSPRRLRRCHSLPPPSPPLSRRHRLF